MSVSELSGTITISIFMFSWLVGCFGFNGPLRQYCSLYRAASQREGEITDGRNNRWEKTCPKSTKK